MKDILVATKSYLTNVCMLVIDLYFYPSLVYLMLSLLSSSMILMVSEFTVALNGVNILLLNL